MNAVPQDTGKDPASVERGMGMGVGMLWSAARLSVACRGRGVVPPQGAGHRKAAALGQLLTRAEVQLLAWLHATTLNWDGGRPSAMLHGF